MSIEDEIQREEHNHKQVVQMLFETEHRLKQLYAAKTTVEVLHERFEEEGIEVQIVQRVNRNEVTLRKNEVAVTCIVSTLPGALFGAYTAWLGEMARAL